MSDHDDEKRSAKEGRDQGAEADRASWVEKLITTIDDEEAESVETPAPPRDPVDGDVITDVGDFDAATRVTTPSEIPVAEMMAVAEVEPNEVEALDVDDFELVEDIEIEPADAPPPPPPPPIFGGEALHASVATPAVQQVKDVDDVPAGEGVTLEVELARAAEGEPSDADVTLAAEKEPSQAEFSTAVDEGPLEVEVQEGTQEEPPEVEVAIPAEEEPPEIDVAVPAEEELPEVEVAIPAEEEPLEVEVAIPAEEESPELEDSLEAEATIAHEDEETVAVEGGEAVQEVPRAADLSLSADDEPFEADGEDEEDDETLVAQAPEAADDARSTYEGPAQEGLALVEDDPLSTTGSLTDKGVVAPLAEAVNRAKRSDLRALSREIQDEAELATDLSVRAAMLRGVGRVIAQSGGSSEEIQSVLAESLALAPGVEATRWDYLPTLDPHGRLEFFDRLLEMEQEGGAKAELMVEKAWLLLDELDARETAHKVLLEALEVDAEALLPAVVLERMAAGTGDVGLLAVAHEQVARRAADPERRAAALRDLARIQPQLDEGSPERAVELLSEAASVVGDPLPVLLQQARVAERFELHEARLDVMERLARDLAASQPRIAVAYLRRAAVVALDELRDADRARRLVEEAAGIVPDEPILELDRARLARRTDGWQELAEMAAARAEQAQERGEESAVLADLYFDLGGLLHRAGKSEEAEQALARCLELRPGYLPALIEREREAFGKEPAALLEIWLQEAEGAGRGGEGDAAPLVDVLWRAALVAGRWMDDAERGIELCRRALDVDAEHAPSRELLQELLERAGKFEELAGVLAVEAEAEVENDAKTSERRARALERLVELHDGPLDQPAEAVKALAQLIELRGEDLTTRRLMVALHDRQGEAALLERALADLEQLEDEAGALRCTLQRARLFEGALERPEEAVNCYRSVLERRPDNPHALEGLELLLRRRKEFSQLADVLAEVAEKLETPEQKAGILVELARICERDLDDAARAMKALEELIETTPDDLAALREAQRLCRKTGENARYVAICEREIARMEGPAAARRRLRLAEFVEDLLGDAQQAAEIFESVAWQPTGSDARVEALHALAQLHTAKRRFADAARALEQLRREAPDGARALFTEELAWGFTQDSATLEEGERLWGELLEQDPAHRGGLQAKLRAAVKGRDGEALVAALDGLIDVSGVEVAAELQLRRAALGDKREGAYRAALKAGVGESEARWGLLAESGVESEEAEQLWTALRAELPEAARPEVDLQIARHAINAGRFAEAAEIVQGMLVEQPDDVAVLLEASRLAAVSGDAALEGRCWLKLSRVVESEDFRRFALGRASTRFEEAKEVEGAIVCCWQTLALDASDQGAVERLERLCRQTGDEAALERLLGHKLRLEEERGARIALLHQRSAVRQRIGDVKGEATDLLRLLELDSDHLDALRGLARLADEQGDVVRAVAFYRRLMGATDSEPLRRDAVVRLADLLCGAGRAAEAVDVCRRFYEGSPRDPEVLRRLADAHEQVPDYARAVEALERLEAVTEDAEERAAVLLRVARLQWRKLNDINEGRRSLYRALEQDPTHLQALDELRALCRKNKLDSELEQRLERAKDDIRQLLGMNPLDVGLYEKLLRVAEWAEDQYTLLATLGALSCFNAIAPAERSLYQRRVKMVRFEPKQLLTAHAWNDGVCARGAKSAYGGIWQLIAHAVPKLYPDLPGLFSSPEQLGVGRGDLLAKDSKGAAAAVLRIATAFGLGEFDIYLSRSDPKLVAGLAGEQHALVLGHEVVSQMGAGDRFRVGRALALMRERAFAIELLPPEDVLLIVSAAIHEVEPGAPLSLPRDRVEEMSRRLHKALSRKERKALPLAVNRFLHEEGVDVVTWSEALLATAQRAALLVCGDVVVGLQQLVEGFGDPATRDRDGNLQLLATNLPAAQMLPFSVSRQYLDLRRSLQL